MYYKQHTNKLTRQQAFRTNFMAHVTYNYKLLTYSFAGLQFTLFRFKSPRK
jgi:hypothetical protein